MSLEFLLQMGARLVLGSVASFLAIWLWSKTRDSSWLLMVLGTVFLFMESVLEILDRLGLSVYDLVVIQDVSVLKIVMAALPFLFYSVGFIIFLINKRWY